MKKDVHVIVAVTNRRAWWVLLILTSVSYFMKGSYQGANMKHF